MIHGAKEGTNQTVDMCCPTRAFFYCSLLRFLVVIGPDHVKQKYFLEIIIRSDKVYNLSGQVKKVARVSKQYILYYLSTCNKDANGQHDLRLCCSHRL